MSAHTPSLALPLAHALDEGLHEACMALLDERYFASSERALVAGAAEHTLALAVAPPNGERVGISMRWVRSFDANRPVLMSAG